MELFTSYIKGFDNPEHRERLEEIYAWMANTFPQLEPVLKWNTPMFTDHGTFIIGIDAAKHHMSFAPEAVTMTRFADDIKEAGYSATKGLFRIKWNQPVDYELLKRMIEFNIEDKAGHEGFWR
ncbi:iron chaperone [Jeotgalibacillus proteolyticus]|uniref:Iron chaperone n=1 Tax=Jeotgalibacillus proteolyticus TaxID=2082395 RepID=A0A2S5G7X1_9BACL|nr:iron chaperone [Jeotgalibacillus proteolyticus]PPA69092.1 iron chaperone [Jeotgalibacillus proteolyticus]